MENGIERMKRLRRSTDKVKHRSSQSSREKNKREGKQMSSRCKNISLQPTRTHQGSRQGPSQMMREESGDPSPRAKISGFPSETRPGQRKEWELFQTYQQQCWMVSDRGIKLEGK